MISAIQEVITGSGGKSIVIDGLAGPATMSATVWYQKEHGLTPNGLADRELVDFIHNGAISDKAEIVDNDQVIWEFLIGKGLSPAGAAGLMGNLEAESCLKPTNLQNTYESKLGFSDDTYTKAVDNGTYTGFVSDCAGYGLAQWTYHTRKAGLLAFCKESGRSIGSLAAQLEFLFKELSESYKSLLDVLKKTDSIKEASDLVLTRFERPADMSDSVKEKRASFGKAFFDKFANAESEDVADSESWWDEIEYFTRD